MDNMTNAPLPQAQDIKLPEPPKYEPKVYKPLEKRDFLFAGLYLLSSFLMVSFGLFGGFHLGFSIAYFVLFAVSTAYLIKKETKPNIFAIACGLLSLAGSVTFALFTDYFINTIMVVLIGGLFAVYTIGISDSFNYRVGSFRMLLDLVKDTAIYPFQSLSDVFGGIKASAEKSKKSLSGFIGIAVAIPFVLVIGALLMSSDAAFEGLISKMFKDIGIYLLHLLLALVVVPYFFTKDYSKRNKYNIESVGSKSKRMGVPVSAGVSFLAVISVLYVMYLFSQLAYFFSAFKGILPADYKYTASAFARRGFFEMFAICAINIVLISVVTAISKKKSLWLKLLSTFISLFSVLLIITAMQKMKLNVSIYGLSKNRVLVTVFMVMMLVVIAFFIIHIFAPKISYMQPIILICSAMFIALSFADIDTQIARYNINAYESGKIESLDIETIGNLSDSAVPYLVDLTNSDDDKIASKALVISAQLMSDNYSKYFDKIIGNEGDFKSYSYAKHMAILALDDAKRAEDISKTSKLFDEENMLFYNEERNSFEDYSLNDGWDEYQYNKDTRLFDKKVHHNNDD